MISLFISKIKTQFWRNSKILDEIWKFDYSTIFENYFINKKTNTHRLVFLHLSYIITSIFHQHSYLSEKLPLKFYVWFSRKQNCFCLFHILLSPSCFFPQKVMKLFGVPTIHFKSYNDNKKCHTFVWHFGSPSSSQPGFLTRFLTQ